MSSSSHEFPSQAPLSFLKSKSSTMESSSGNYIIPFPIKLRAMLEETEAKGLSHIVRWEMEGTAFRVHDPEEFVRQIMGKWFNQTKYKSFQRQLNLYGFNRVSRGPQKGCYFHEKFQRDQPEWTDSICRKKVSDEDFTEAELIAPSWLPDATRSVLEPTPIRDDTQAPKAMMDAFEAYFQTKVVARSSSPPTATTTTIKAPVSQDVSKSTCSGNALQRFLDKVLETDGTSSGNKPHAVAQDDETDSRDDTTNLHKRTSRCSVFPDKLHDMLGYCETNGLHRVCCWEMDGRAFRIRSIDLFTEQVMPKFFKLTKFESLQRQLNLYSFTRIARGPMKGCYYHPLFVRGGRNLSKDMQRRKADDCPTTTTTTGMASSASTDVAKSFSKKRRISISESESNNQDGALSTDTRTMPCRPTMTRSSAIFGISQVDDDELDMMARSCFDVQSHAGVSMLQSSSFNLQFSNAMTMGMMGVSRIPVTASVVSPPGMVLSAGWDHLVNHGSMSLGQDVFSLDHQASQR